MRRIDKSHVVVPAALSKIKPSGKTETEEAIEFYLKKIAKLASSPAAKKDRTSVV